MLRTIRRFIYKLMLIQPINMMGALFFKCMPISISARGSYVFPVKGALPIQYGPFGSFYMVSEGADSIASRAYFCGALNYEAATARSLTALFMDSKCFFDIGANTGICSLMAAKHSNLEKIFAFEPVPNIVSHLKANIERNNAQNLTAHRLALAAHSGTLQFQVPQDAIVLPLGSSGAGSTKHYSEAVDVVTVDTVSLDDFVERNKVYPDVIKIDTETTEPEVVSGGLNYIKNHRPSLVVEVLNKEVGRSLEAFFENLNYQFLFLTDEGHLPVKEISPDPSAHFLNYALIPEEKLKRYQDNLAKITSH